MKTNKIINKLIAYARDNLMLDALDEVYTAGRLSSLCGVTPEYEEVECDETFDKLFAELKAAAPNVDKTAVLDILLPLPHTVNYYFSDELDRNANKAFDFVYELYATDGNAVSSDGYAFYTDSEATDRAVSIPVGNDELEYTPVVGGVKKAYMSCPDILTSDVTARMAAYAETYGGAIVYAADRYLSACDTALDHAVVKEQIKTGAVKIALLDYPVPALKISGIAKNATAREAARIINAAADENIKTVTACTAKDGVTFYVVFANDLQSDDIFKSTDALAACGVVGTVDLKEITSVLEKGTALSTDLFAFKPVYAAVGGVKHGAKAKTALAGALAKLYAPVLAKAASADAEKAKALAAAAETEEL